MGLTIVLLLGLSAFVCTIASALGKCPLWIPTMLLCVIVLLGALPLGAHAPILTR